MAGKGRKQVLRNGDEWDAAHPRSRHLLAWGSGELARIKKGMKQARQERGEGGDPARILTASVCREG